jgi:hypothetical protein
MNDLSISLNGGIGDVILSNNLIGSIKDQYNIINIGPNNDIMRKYRNNDHKYYDFLLNFLSLFFSDNKKYMIHKNNNFQRFSIIDNILVNTKIPDDGLYNIKIANKLIDLELPPISTDEYIVITTKVRGLPLYNLYIKIYKKQILETLKKCSKKYKIVIIGDRGLPTSIEYKTIGNQRVYCIYNDLINELPQDRILDLTVNDTYIDVPDITKLIQDCTYMNKAKAVITIGYGGNFILALAASTTCISFVGDRNNLGADIPYYLKMCEYPNKRSGVYTFTDFNVFINKIKDI